MSVTKGINELIDDVREHVLYAKELGVELLDVEVAANETKPVVHGVDATLTTSVNVPRELPDVSMPVSVQKTSVRKPSKLSALPSLSKRPTMSGNAATAAKEI